MLKLISCLCAYIGLARNLSWRGHSSWGGALLTPEWPRCKPSELCRLLGRKIEIWCNFFLLKMYFLGILGGAIAPLCPSLAIRLCRRTLAHLLSSLVTPSPSVVGISERHVAAVCARPAAAAAGRVRDTNEHRRTRRCFVELTTTATGAF